MNEPLLYAALVDLTIHPEKHDQTIWLERRACGTKMCLAGDVVLLAGMFVEWELRYANSDWGKVWTALRLSDPRRITIRQAAIAALEISYYAAEDLFAESNTIHDLWALASIMTDGRVSRPEGL